LSLTFESARNGQAIYKIDGRSVVSSFDPAKEARGWAENAVKEIGDRESVVILGAGCGYHILALRELRPSLSILTIEESKDIAAFAHTVLASQPDIDVRQFGEIIVASRPIELTESLILRDFMSHRYAVVTHAGLAAVRPDWTHEMATFLTGRDYLSFLLQLRMRPELHALFDEEKIAKLQASTSPISILTIRSLFSAQAQNSRERRLWRVLEELIV
jgi:hypothetical protein